MTDDREAVQVDEWMSLTTEDIIDLVEQIKEVPNDR